MFYAGCASFDMSPSPGVELAGYPHFHRNNTGVHDPLIANCLYLKNEGLELALVTLDILFYSKLYVTEAREKVEAACGMQGKNIIISCSHTHSGPWASGRLDKEAIEAGRSDADYIHFLTDGIVDMVIRARETAFPAELGVGSGICGAERGVGGNRRVKGGVHDPSVGVIAVRDKSGVVRCVLANYTLHPTFIHEDSSVVTADYPAYIRRQVQEALPGVEFGFAQGASGDQSSRYFRQGQSHDEAERVGREIGKEVLSVLRALSFSADPKLAIAGATVEFDLRTYAPIDELRAEAEATTAVYERLKAEGAPYIDVQNANLKMLGAEDILGYAEMVEKGGVIKLLVDERPAEVCALRLGDAAIACVPGEYFVEFALRIKRESPFTPTIVFELSNGCLPGYCYTREALAEGGYEVDTSMLTPEFGDKMTSLAVELVKSLGGGK